MHRRGVTESPGLYFLSLPWQHTRGSALLGWVKDDAEHIAEHIRKSHSGTTATYNDAITPEAGPATEQL